MQTQVEGFRLSPQQRALWQLRREGGAGAALCAVRLEGALGRGRLQKALRRVVERHEILRTTFPAAAGFRLPVQVVGESAAPSWRELDFSHLDRREQAEAVEQFVAEEAGREFDAAQGPPLRASLLALAADRHALVLGLFPLCADARTLANVVRELCAEYAGGGRVTDAADEPLQYVQFAEWQNELLEGEEGEEGRAYWNKRGGFDTSGLRFSFETNRPERGAFEPRTFGVMFSAETLARVADLSEKCRTGVEAFFLSCWQVLVWRHTGQSDPTVGVTLDGRKFEELEGAMGAFARTLPVGCRLEEKTRFRSLLVESDAAVRDARGWQEYFAADGDEKEGAHLYFPCAFEFTERPARLDALGVSFSVFKQLAHPDRFKLKLSCAHAGAGLLLEFHYDPESFRADEVELLAAQFERLTLSAVEHPEAAVGELEMSGEAERRRLLVEWNETRAAYPAEKCVQELFEERAALTPEAVAVECGGARLSFAELNGSANRLAHRLRKMGVGPETLVGIALPRSPEMVAGLWAVLKAGGAYVPVDLSYPQERMAFMLEGARVVLTSAEVLARLPDSAAARALCLDAESDNLDGEPAADPSNVAAPANLAYVLYTSGSTGRPKGVMVTHRGLVNYLSWATKAYRANEGEGAPVHSPLGFDLTVTSLLAPLLAGRPVVLPAEEQGVDGLVAALRDRGDFGLVKLTPAHLQILGRVAQAEEAAKWARVFVVGGEALFWQDLAFWREHAPATRLINEYGPTETVVGCCVHEVGGDERGEGVVPIGRPIANTEIYLLDRHLRPAPVGVAGELYIGGDGVARGYFGRPDLTAERFVPHPFSSEPGARLYRSGDLARYRADGVIEYLGRTDSQVKVRGYRIELGEIEAALNGQAGVRESAVTVHDDASGDRRLVAYVVGERGRRPDANEVRARLQTILPDYMVPSAFVVLDELPLTSNGKVDRKRLPAPDAVTEATNEGAAHVAPRDLLELRLARAWEELLGRRGFGVRDDFFQLGGHSMLAARLVARIGQEFGVQLPLNVLFREATVERLAALVRQQTRPAGRASSLVEIQPGETRRPFFLVHPSGGNVLCYVELARHLGPDQPVYGFQSLQSGESPSHTRVEEMAAHYVAELRAAEPVGPYLLGGWSSGGLVAFEMARQLQTEGERVALIALLDTRAPLARQRAPRPDELELLADFAEDIGLPLADLPVAPEELLRRGPHELLPRVLEVVRAANVLPPDLELSQLRGLYQVFRNNVTAARAYAPAAVRAPVTLFRAEEGRDAGEHDASWGWGELTTGGVEVYAVPGDHFRMVRAPHAEVLARKLRACLDAAVGRQSEASLVRA
ncbi:MAG TPA: amino acid adenylation domain-containing protein [Pyrinomonadaceae bacterium]|nr:amino acid adenylation domain-containing protein [Pyrinomonadaceae bacterium]